jgi:hypothetical protein
MRGLLSETVNHKLSAEGIILWVPTLGRAYQAGLQEVDLRPPIHLAFYEL